MAGKGILSDFDRPAYQTPLTPEQEMAFQLWKRQVAPNDTGEDYDLRGAFLAQFGRAPNGHMGYRFKMPNHPTFSDQSQYAKVPGTYGHWPKEGDTMLQKETTDADYYPSLIRQLFGR